MKAVPYQKDDRKCEWTPVSEEPHPGVAFPWVPALIPFRWATPCVCANGEVEVELLSGRGLRLPKDRQSQAGCPCHA